MARVMDQISPPFRIALVALLVFVGAWMTVLKPHPAAGGGDEAPLPAAPAAAAAPPASSSAPGVAGLERSVKKAKDAASASEASTAAVQAADPEQPAAEPTPAARAAAAPRSAAPPAAARKRAAPAARAVKTVVLFAGAGADDAVARHVVRAVRRRGVRTIIASLSQLGRYRNLVGTMEIASAPTILVIGRDRKAQKIEGLPDEAQVRAALAAAR